MRLSTDLVSASKSDFFSSDIRAVEKIPGPDGIPNELIQIFSNVFLTLICNA